MRDLKGALSLLLFMLPAFPLFFVWTWPVWLLWLLHNGG